ncbi:MAG TPA: hypothetical protein VLT47_11090 [Anaeromyxobacteraceae bacterium]|nr:hypothetical protein [Anaeromyxobacteraceae bacterium]
MKPPAVLQVAIPAGAVTLAPPPRLVSAVNADYVGLTTAQIKDVLRDMERHPLLGREVFRVGRVRLAPPDAVIRYLETRPRPVASEPEAVDEEAKASREAWGG